jgi:hypothetical protein
MDERQRRVVQHMRNASRLEDLYDHGYGPDDIKAALLALFAPYSQNPDALRAYVVDYMVADAISLASIGDSAWALQILEEALRVQRLSIAADRDLALRAMAHRLAAVSAGLDIYWSQYHLSHGLHQLELEEFVHESLRLIGTLIEGVMKPLLYALAHHVQIGKGRRPIAQAIDTMTLGNVLDLLVREASSANVYSIRGVRLNQWRNIAQHLTARLDGTNIVFRYNNGQDALQLTRSELLDVAYDVARAHKAIKVAHAIVFFDHLDEMRNAGIVVGQSLRPEASLGVLVSGLASQGFRVVDASFTEEHSLLVVQDVSRLDPNSRRVHTAQFVIPLYLHRPAERVTVEYRRRDGTPALRTSASRALIERAKEADDFTIVAREAEMTELESER